MLDFIKLYVYDQELRGRLLNHSAVKLTSRGDEFVSFSITINGWVFKGYTDAFVEVRGSFHNYWNGGTNENDFTYSNIIKTIKRFCTEFNIKAENAKVINLEFGVNLMLNYPAKFIMDYILCFKNKQPTTQFSEPDRYLREFEMTEYFVKVYDKARQQQKLNIDSILRIEIKAMKSRYLIFANIRILQDLLDYNKLNQLAAKLRKEVGHLILSDYIDKKKLTEKERKLYELLMIPKNWKYMKGNCKLPFFSYHSKL